MDVPITEADNPITQNIDVASPQDIVSLLQKCDAEIFNGWGGHEGLFHTSTISTIDKVKEIASAVIQNASSSLVVLSGCGTSGRIAFIISRTFNQKLIELGKEPCFRYLVAGRDKALFTSQEAPEDDPICGKEMLQEVCTGKSKVLFIGITCGLSAPYVAGQLQHCMQNLDVFTPVLLGFNPTHLARNNQIEKWNKTFLQVVNQLVEESAKGKAFILNPVVGPEPITGSSRMKSGSATKILLETIFVGSFISSQHATVQWDTSSHLKTYKDICDNLYSQQNKNKIADLVQMAGTSLSSGGHIYYAGWDNLGIMGMMDASECPPTYGASLDDIRGFLEDGYSALRNTEGDLSNLGKHFRISLEDMEKDIIPYLTSNDLVIVLSEDGTTKISKALSKSNCKKGCVHFKSSASQGSTLEIEYDEVLHVKLAAQEQFESTLKEFTQLYREICTKLICNAVTTGAHIIKGKVYQNIMVDLKVSNNKLFYRAVGIIQKFSNLSKEAAQEYLLRSIYETDLISETQSEMKITEHIEVATTKERIVPKALLSALTKCSIMDAEQQLQKQPVVRTVISRTLAKTTSSN